MKIALLLVTLMAAVHMGSAVMCYDCAKGVELKDCKKDTECANGCLKSQVTKGEMGENDFLRGCSATKWDEEECKVESELTKCYCNSKECNSGHSLAPPSILALVLVLATAKGLLM